MGSINVAMKMTNHSLQQEAEECEGVGGQHRVMSWPRRSGS
jgi:hypothetical protein